MKIYGFVPIGFEGGLVSVEADLRRTIPGFDLVGLPDGAVKEARERVRAALRNTGFAFPRERVLINLSPAGVRKEGASFDLPIALSVLIQSGQISLPVNSCGGMMVVGELNLSGTVRPVPGILAAVLKAAEEKIRYVMVPGGNRREAETPGCCTIIGVNTLGEAATRTAQIAAGKQAGFKTAGADNGSPSLNSGMHAAALPGQTIGPAVSGGDFQDIKGHEIVKRALEVAAAGRHNMFLFGPPGSGKTMAAQRFPSILPFLSPEEAIEVTKIYSLAGILPVETGLIARPPFRMPHHSASQEGIIGGGKGLHPGEISFAHRGVLFLDEAPEFKKSILQSLREPLEAGRVSIARASNNYWFPADFQLLLAANPCPCGNLGIDDKVCMCSIQEIEGYWKKIGGPLMDRIDLRVPIQPVKAEAMFSAPGETSADIKSRVAGARKIQDDRYRLYPFRCNARIPPGSITKFCGLTEDAQSGFGKAVEKLGLSSRACHSVLKIARTIADLEGADGISREHLFEAVQHRRYGDGDYFWSERF